MKKPDRASPRKENSNIDDAGNHGILRRTGQDQVKCGGEKADRAGHGEEIREKVGFFMRDKGSEGAKKKKQDAN